MLALALEKLARAKPVGEIDVRIFLDVAPAEVVDEVEYVRDAYYPEAMLFQAKPHISAPSGCWNILHALKQGYSTGSDLVMLVEEDVMVYPYYFETVVRDCPYFAFCGRYLRKYQSQFYTNPGSCFPRESLAKVVPHICDQFFEDRRGYMDRTFGQMDEASDLDDGLIRRIIKHDHAEISYFNRPVVAHQGFHAYRLFAEYQNDGNITERIARLREMIETINPEGRYTKDFEPWRPE